jgi:CubicO group peptidase (beta-lactamase class C family)
LKNTNRAYLFGFIFFSIGSDLVSQSLYFPNKQWEVKNPTALNINPALLDTAVTFAIKNESKMDYDLRLANIKAYAREPNYKILGPMKHRGKPAGLIIKNGYIVAQWGDLKRVDMTFSVAKSYLSTVAGLTLDAGLINNVDEKVEDYVTDGTYDGAHNSKVTWRHLLTQSSDWSGCMFDLCDWADRPPLEGGLDEWKNRKLLEPGSTYEYNDVRVNLLAYSLLQVWRKPLPTVFKEKVMDPIGASTTWRWTGYDNSFVNVDGTMVQSISGGGHFGGGLFINTYDQARFGLLFARNGKWNNSQIISDNWIKAATQPSIPNNEYGFLWWLNTNDEFKGLSKNIFYANGFGGNYIVVDKEKDLVIVTRWLDTSKLGEFVSLVYKSLTP